MHQATHTLHRISYSCYARLNAAKIVRNGPSQSVAKRNVCFSCRSLQSDDGPGGPTGFARAFEDQEGIKKEIDVISTSTKGVQDSQHTSFASMLRKSPFIGLGDFRGRLVAGKIMEVVDNNLFIDYGGKFHCVCRMPRENLERYKRGSDVIIKLLNWELSARFLGSTRDVTLLESDAILMGEVVRSKELPGSSTEARRLDNIANSS